MAKPWPPRIDWELTAHELLRINDRYRDRIAALEAALCDLLDEGSFCRQSEFDFCGHCCGCDAREAAEALRATYAGAATEGDA